MKKLLAIVALLSLTGCAHPGQKKLFPQGMVTVKHLSLPDCAKEGDRIVCRCISDGKVVIFNLSLDAKTGNTAARCPQAVEGQ